MYRYLLIAAATSAAPAFANPPKDHPVTTTGAGLVSPVRADFGRVSLMASALAQEFRAACPVAKPDSRPALDACKSALYKEDSALRRALPDFVLWGRMRDASLPLKETHLTQFGRDVFTAAYIPLFMFTGKHEVSFDEREQLFRIDMQVAFRNRLQPGEFPYPFWHDENKWMTYQGANRMTIWVGNDKGAGTERIKAMQFSVFGKNVDGMPQPIPMPAFDKDTHGKWLWTDAAGKTQPQVTLFDGQYSAANPHLKRLDDTYREMALELRNDECMGCHVPSNPDKMKRLVLLQTPAHAGSEVARIIKAVREDRMPLDDVGIEQPMPQDKKQVLLAKAQAFEAAIKDAKAWEAGRNGRKVSQRKPAAAGS